VVNQSFKTTCAFEVFVFPKIIIKLKEVSVQKFFLMLGLWTAGPGAAAVCEAGSLLQERAGISLRGSYWSKQNQDVMVRVNNHGFADNRIDAGGAGGWITFFSGVGERGGIEFSIGGVGRAEVIEDGLFSDEVKVTAAMPILLGFQYPLFGDRSKSSFQPYVAAGGGPYILSRVDVLDNDFSNEEVTVKNRVRAGVYGSAGGYFLLSGWFAVQGEMRYHLVNFNTSDTYSGLELGLGLAFFWRR
jgi:hypothetical protein